MQMSSAAAWFKKIVSHSLTLKEEKKWDADCYWEPDYDRLCLIVSYVKGKRVAEVIRYIDQADVLLAPKGGLALLCQVATQMVNEARDRIKAKQDAQPI